MIRHQTNLQGQAMHRGRFRDRAGKVRDHSDIKCVSAKAMDLHIFGDAADIG